MLNEKEKQQTKLYETRLKLIALQLWQKSPATFVSFPGGILEESRPSGAPPVTSFSDACSPSPTSPVVLSLRLHTTEHGSPIVVERLAYTVYSEKTATDTLYSFCFKIAGIWLPLNRACP